MNDHLSQDPRQWPDDPFELLGVVPPVTEQDLKRAYTRLIRRFKPEHHPEEFRRVREAYEIALWQIQWIQYFPASGSVEAATDPAPVPIAESTQELQPAPPQESACDTPSEPLPVEEKSATLQPVIDPVEDAWALAVAGKRAEAYALLVDLARDRPESPDALLRLYWLLALDSGLDAERGRHDWLAAALVRSSLQGPAVELYQRELIAYPQEALFGPYVDLLALPGASPEAVIGLARERLAAAAIGGWWTRMDGDLWTLAGRSGEIDEANWLWYLVQVMNLAAFDHHGALFERCSNLLRELRHLELSHAWAFDRVDEVRAVGERWRRGLTASEPVRELVRSAWSGSAQMRLKNLKLAAAWASADPAHSLYEFDKIAHEPYFAPMLGTLAGMLEEHPPAESGVLSPDLIRGLAAAFLKDGVRKDYTAMRPALIKFLLDERIDPRDLASACSVDAQYKSRSLAEHVRQDGVLWLVWQTATAVDG
jgi:hypothetical protein